MTAQRVGRMIVALASVAFAGVAVTLWAAPVQAAHALGPDIGELAVELGLIAALLLAARTTSSR